MVLPQLVAGAFPGDRQEPQHSAKVRLGLEVFHVPHPQPEPQIHQGLPDHCFFGHFDLGGGKGTVAGGVERMSDAWLPNQFGEAFLRTR